MFLGVTASGGHRRYKLRAKVELSDASSSLSIFVAAGPEAAAWCGAAGGAALPAGGVVFVDPRAAPLGVRAVIPAGAPAEELARQWVDRGWGQVAERAYDHFRLAQVRLTTTHVLAFFVMKNGRW